MACVSGRFVEVPTEGARVTSLGLKLMRCGVVQCAAGEASGLNVAEDDLLRALEGASDMLTGVLRFVGRVLSPWQAGTTGPF